MATNNPDEIAIEITQEEIWDDSTLVETWDEALKEYKKYHSIAATGENVEALVKAAGTVAKVEEEEMKDAPAPTVEAETEVEPKIEVEEKTPDPKPVASPPQVQPEPEPEPPAFPFAQQHPAGAAAGYAIGGNDESMRNLMMAWYWAGYYTGLQEGQKQQ
ncbi:hypothetical protein BDD12DRAFT_873788 [Trichophaea hybrida]|nr:hypothetical protein BDD12DRAFT_873788 [Trichophaea hybrida]